MTSGMTSTRADTGLLRSARTRFSDGLKVQATATRRDKNCPCRGESISAQGRLLRAGSLSKASRQLLGGGASRGLEAVGAVRRGGARSDPKHGARASRAPPVFATSSASPREPTLEMFTAPGCTHCDRLRSELTQRGVDWVEWNIETEEGPMALTPEVERRMRHARFNTVPQLYLLYGLEEEHLGGADDVAREASNGELDARLARAGLGPSSSEPAPPSPPPAAAERPPVQLVAVGKRFSEGALREDALGFSVHRLDQYNLARLRSIGLALRLNQVQQMNQREIRALLTEVYEGWTPDTVIDRVSDGQVKPENVVNVHSEEELLKTLQILELNDTLVVCYFWRYTCYACKSTTPKLLKYAADVPQVTFLRIDYNEFQDLCGSVIQLKHLPFVQVYRGSEGLLDQFALNITVFPKFRSIVKRHAIQRCNLSCDLSCPYPPPITWLPLGFTPPVFESMDDISIDDIFSSIDELPLDSMDE